MNTARQTRTERQQHSQNENNPYLRIAFSTYRKSRSTESLIYKAWLFAKSALWENETFSEEQIKTFKKRIAEFFEETEYSEAMLVEFMERVILAKRYVARSSYRYIAAPALWLNIHFKYGISGTESWYREVEEQRETAPEYNLGMNLLAEAVEMYTNDPCPVVYEVCRKKLIEMKQYDLVPVFNSTVLAFHYQTND